MTTNLETIPIILPDYLATPLRELADQAGQPLDQYLVSLAAKEVYRKDCAAFVEYIHQNTPG